MPYSRSTLALVRAALCGAAATALAAGTAAAQTSEPSAAVPATPAPASPEPAPVTTAAPARSAADAASAGGPAGEIVVTGTSIRGVAPVGAPIIGLDQAAIQQQPVNTTVELLRNIPSVISTGASDQFFGAANNANANITGGNGINLRGLGTEATLTLLNGRRLPPAGTMGQFFDPSIIPTSAIGRLEVMADGGSAIYGSDAVGGVVNILLRRRFSGVETYLRKSSNGDVNGTVVGGVVGHTWGSGNIMLSGEHQRRTALAAAARARYTDDLSPFGGADQRLFNANPGNIQIGSVRYPIPAAQNGSGLRPAQLLATAPANRESAFRGLDAIPGQQRDSVIGSLHQDVVPGVSLWTEGYYAHRRLDRTINADTSSLTVPSLNPFYVVPAGATAPACPASAGVAAGTRCLTVNYSFYPDYGPRVQNAFQRAWQLAAGTDARLGGDWSLGAYGSYGRNQEERTNPAINNAQLAAALRDPNPATAFNPFGDGSYTNPATLARLRGFSTIGARYDLWDFSAKLDGTLFALPGGRAKLAVGGEYQRAKQFTYQRNNTSTVDTATITEIPSTVRRNVKSAYAELFVPVFGRDNAVAGIRELSLSAAIRHDRYSDFGTTTNPKLALRYTPIDGLSLRGTFGKSFRAPLLSDLDDKTLTINFVDLVSPTGPVRTLLVRGGNAGLGPEKATIWSVGADFRPTFAKDLNLSVTYFNVDYKNRIENPGNDTLVLSTPAREAALGALIVRNPSADLVNSFQNLPQYFGTREDPANVRAFVDGRRVNVGRLQTRGIEASAQYAHPVGAGEARIGANATYLLAFKRAILPNATPDELVNTINNPQRFRTRGDLGYSRGKFSVDAFVNYSGRYTNDAVTPSQWVASYTTVDLSIRQGVNPDGRLGVKKLVFSFDVQNLFDRAPPLAFNGNLPFDPQVASILGRFFTVGVRANW